MRRVMAVLALLLLVGCGVGVEAKPPTADDLRQQCATRWINAYPNGKPCYSP